MREELKPAQSKTTMMIVCWFLGGLGIHKMMMGHEGWWKRIFANLICGLGWILALIDLVKIYNGSLKMADGRDLV